MALGKSLQALGAERDGCRTIVSVLVVTREEALASGNTERTGAPARDTASTTGSSLPGR